MQGSILQTFFAPMADCILHFVCCTLNSASFSTLSFSSTSGYITPFLIEINYRTQIVFCGLVFSTLQILLFIWYFAHTDCILHRLSFLVTSGHITPILIETNDRMLFNKAMITFDLQRSIVQVLKCDKRLRC